MLPLKGH